MTIIVLYHLSKFIEYTTKKTKTKENNNYNDMSVIELKKMAQNKKIKGYYNLHKEELVKALEEAETLQK
jgi:hypothetical protein